MPNRLKLTDHIVARLTADQTVWYSDAVLRYPVLQWNDRAAPDHRPSSPYISVR
jgi:hypothetical protein